jgi:hypothetical protein
MYDKTDTYLIGGRYPNAYYLNAMYIGKALPDAESENIMHFSFENQKSPTGLGDATNRYRLATGITRRA